MSLRLAVIQNLKPCKHFYSITLKSMSYVCLIFWLDLFSVIGHGVFGKYWFAELY